MDNLNHDSSGLDQEVSATAEGRTWLFFAAILIIGLGVRVLAIKEPRLWLDEIVSVTLAAQPIRETLLGTLRFDLHPPLYYLQLHFWAIFGRSDLWLLLNSVAWSAVAMISLFGSARRVFGRREALTAMLLLAVTPISVIHSQNVRMYSMLMALAVWAWYLNHRSFERGRPSVTVYLAAIVELLIVYSHASGVFMAAIFGLYGLARLVETGPLRRYATQWLWVQAGVALLSLPAVANAMVRSVSHTTAPGPRHVARELGWMIFGVGKPLGEEVGVLAIVLVVGLAVASIVYPRARLITWMLVVTPLVLAIAISYVLKPMWHARSLLFITPFWVLSIAVVIWSMSRMKPTQRVVVIGVTSLVLAAFSVTYIVTRDKPNNFKAAAAEMTRDVRSGDVVYVPDRVRFWGVAWYFVGPGWGSALEVQDPVATDRWGQILERLGPGWRARLQLEPQTQRVVHRGIPVVVGESMAAAVAAEAERVFLVSDYSLEEIPAELSGFVEVESRDYRGIVVRLLELQPESRRVDTGS